MDQYADIIIGGGPAGLFTAINIVARNRRVLLLEKKRQCGLKLLVSGSGQCNITHDGDIREFISHYGENGKFLRPALMNFSNRDLTAFFEERGLSFISEPGGKKFPKSKKGRDILDILVRECEAERVEIRYDEPVESVSKTSGTFMVTTRKGRYSSETLVISTGGITYPSTGSTGDGLVFSKMLGHPITEVGPALTGIYVKEYPFSDLSGISLSHIPLSLFREGKKVRRSSGDILFTHNGISGPGILDLSRYIRTGDILQISFLSGSDAKTHSDILINRINTAGKKRIKTLFSNLNLPERLVKKILVIAGVNPDAPAAQLKKGERESIFRLLTAFPAVISGLFGINEAMVTRGGASIADINPKTMESRIVPGLFFAGEVIDIDGDCGGYNLQAAFSTAYLAANGITAFHQRKDPATQDQPS